MQKDLHEPAPGLPQPATNDNSVPQQASSAPPTTSSAPPTTSSAPVLRPRTQRRQPVDNTFFTTYEVDEEIEDEELLKDFDGLMNLGRLVEADTIAKHLSPESQNLERVQLAVGERKAAQSYIDKLQDFDGWTLQVDGNDRGCEGISVWYRYTPGSPIINLKAKMNIPTSVWKIAVIGNEVDLWHTFTSMLEAESDECQRFGYTSWVARLCAHLPWPMQNRECFINFRVHDFMTDKDPFLLLLGESVFDGEVKGYDTGKQTTYKLPPPPRKTMRCKADISVLLEAVSQKECNVTFESQVDFAAPVPNWLVNWFTRKLGWHIAKEFRSRCVNLPETHLQRIKEDKIGIYGYIQGRLDYLYPPHAASAEEDEKSDEPNAAVVV